MHPVLKQISDIGIVPVIAIDDAEKGRAVGKSIGSRRAAGGRDHLPHRRRRGGYPCHQPGGPGNAGRCRHGADPRPAGSCAGRRCQVHRQSRLQPRHGALRSVQGRAHGPRHRHSRRDGAGYGAGSGGSKVLPRRAERRRGQAEGSGRPLQNPEMDAHRRRQCQESGRLSGL